MLGLAREPRSEIFRSWLQAESPSHVNSDFAFANHDLKFSDRGSRIAPSDLNPGFAFVNHFLKFADRGSQALTDLNSEFTSRDMKFSGHDSQVPGDLNSGFAFANYDDLSPEFTFANPIFKISEWGPQKGFRFAGGKNYYSRTTF